MSYPPSAMIRCSIPVSSNVINYHERYIIEVRQTLHVYVCSGRLMAKKGETMGESADYAGFRVLGKACLINVRRSPYARVAIEEDEGLAWLVGAGPSVTRKEKAAWETVRPDCELFCSLYNLVREPLQWELTDDAALFSGASVGEHPFSMWVSQEDALAWCAAHGLPAVEHHQETPEGWLAERLRLTSFQRRTVTLYLLHELWKAFQDHDWNRLDRYLAPFLSKVALVPELQYRTHTEKVALVRKEMNRQLGLSFKQVHLNWTLGDPTPPKLLWRAKSLFGIAHFELTLLMTQQESDQRVKPCRGCLRLFTGHGNSWYCASCDRRTIWSRKKRQAVAAL